MIIQKKRYRNLNIYLKNLFYFIFNWSVYTLISRTKSGTSAKVRAAAFWVLAVEDVQENAFSSPAAAWACNYGWSCSQRHWVARTAVLVQLNPTALTLLAPALACHSLLLLLQLLFFSGQIQWRCSPHNCVQQPHVQVLHMQRSPWMPRLGAGCCLLAAGDVCWSEYLFY